MNFSDTNPKKLGFGFMRLPFLPDDPKTIDIEHTKKMVDYYLESGYTYFDTAVPYLSQRAEAALKVALVDRYPRDSFQIATKLTPHCLSKDLSMEQLFENSLQILGVDYVDCYLLHAMNATRYKEFTDMGAWDFLKRMKQEGKIKHYGFSFHDKASVLEMVLEKHPDMEFVQLQLNYADWESEKVQSRLCHEMAVKYEKPIIIMEPLKGGALGSLVPKAETVFRDMHPEKSIASWGIRYSASLKNVCMVLSGMNTLDQVKNNVATMDAFTPMNQAEYDAVKEVVSILDATPTIPCTDCKYCVEDCVATINIPRYMGIMNHHLRYDADPKSPSNRNPFGFAVRDGSPPSACVGCRRCEGHCPQGIPIVDELKKIADIYES